MSEVLYQDLSYEIVGVAYEVFNFLGYGYQEKIYQKAMALEFKKKKIIFKEQLCFKINYSGEELSKYFLDFLIENKIVVELKVGNMFYKRDYEQVRNYLKANNIELGIVILFSKVGVKFERVLNACSNL